MRYDTLRLDYFEFEIWNLEFRTDFVADNLKPLNIKHFKR